MFFLYFGVKIGNFKRKLVIFGSKLRIIITGFYDLKNRYFDQDWNEFWNPQNCLNLWNRNIYFTKLIIISDFWSSVCLLDLLKKSSVRWQFWLIRLDWWFWWICVKIKFSEGKSKSGFRIVFSSLKVTISLVVDSPSLPIFQPFW